MRFCKDCEHFRPVHGVAILYGCEPSCARPISETLDPLYGNRSRLWWNARKERAKEFRAIIMRGVHCGPAAIFFEPKTEPTRN